MAKKFITTEDVRRASGGEIVVDADTIVTPQAMEYATQNGVRFKDARGAAYSEPPPDRGPDAQRALRTLPHLPEPASDSDIGSTQMVVVTAVGRNRSGVLAEITAALASANGSVHDISQKMVQGYFHLVLTVEVPPGSSFAGLKQTLECLGGQDDYVCRVMHERVFRFMHRV
jgi:ACT domain-containing protein